MHYEFKRVRRHHRLNANDKRLAHSVTALCYHNVTETLNCAGSRFPQRFGPFCCEKLPTAWRGRILNYNSILYAIVMSLTRSLCV